MSPPVAVYVVAAVVGVAAAFAFKEFVYEPHIAPALEVWAENFLERRRARRNQSAAAVPVSSRRGHRRRHSNSSSTSSSNGDSPSKRGPGAGRGQGSNNVQGTDAFELDDLVAREVDQWRNEVLRSQGISSEEQGGLRRRHAGRNERFDLGAFDGMSTSLDESFPSLTHTPLAPTHVISNVSSPITATATATAPHTPSSFTVPFIPPLPSPQANRRAELAEGENRSRPDSQSTATLGETVLVARDSLSPPLSPILSSAIAFSPLTRPLPVRSTGQRTDGEVDDNTSAPHAAAGSITPGHPSGSTSQSYFFPRTPVEDDSPFGPILPEAPSPGSADRPFSPIGRVMGGLGSSTFPFSAIGSQDANGTVPSRSPDGATLERRSSNLVHDIATRLGSGSGIDEPNVREHRRGVEDRDEAGTVRSRSPLNHSHDSQESNRREDEHTSGLEDSYGNGRGYEIGDTSVISSLSERYPIPPSPPVVVSPPRSSSSSHGILTPPSTGSHGVISVPTSPSTSNANSVDIDIVLSSPHSVSARSLDGVMSVPSSRSASPGSRPYQGLFSSLSTLQVPHTGPQSKSRSLLSAGIEQAQSQEPSPTLSFASFLSPMSAARTISESETAEADFMSFVDSDEEGDETAARDSGVAAGASIRTSVTATAATTSAAHQPPVFDRTYNPFLVFEDMMDDSASDEGSEGSDEETSDESDSGDDGSWGSDGSARLH